MLSIEMKPVENSTNVRAIGYDVDSLTLRVEFNTGKVFDYAAVPRGLFEKLAEAPSKGGFLYKHVVRGGYACRPVPIEPAEAVGAEPAADAE